MLKHDSDEHTFWFPPGAEPGETFKEAAVREETGREALSSALNPEP
ncbi:hypothetical protein [Nocardia sp. NPDC050412]